MTKTNATVVLAMLILSQPLFRLLAINLAIGVSVAVLMLGGLLALNPGGLRDLIAADREGAVAVTLLLGGFIITFGSVAMGTAIMSIGGGSDDGRRRGTFVRTARVRVRAR